MLIPLNYSDTRSSDFCSLLKIPVLSMHLYKVPTGKIKVWKPEGVWWCSGGKTPARVAVLNLLSVYIQVVERAINQPSVYLHCNSNMCALWIANTGTYAVSLGRGFVLMQHNCLRKGVQKNGRLPTKLGLSAFFQFASWFSCLYAHISTPCMFSLESRSELKNREKEKG